MVAAVASLDARAVWQPAWLVAGGPRLYPQSGAPTGDPETERYGDGTAVIERQSRHFPDYAAVGSSNLLRSGLTYRLRTPRKRGFARDLPGFCLTPGARRGWNALPDWVYRCVVTYRAESTKHLGREVNVSSSAPMIRLPTGAAIGSWTTPGGASPRHRPRRRQASNPASFTSGAGLSQPLPARAPLIAAGRAQTRQILPLPPPPEQTAAPADPRPTRARPTTLTRTGPDQRSARRWPGASRLPRAHPALHTLPRDGNGPPDAACHVPP